VTYRPDILALYGDLFRDAQATLEKQGALPAFMGRAARAVGNFFTKSPLTQAAEQTGGRSAAAAAPAAAAAAKPAAATRGTWSAVPTSSATPAAESAAARVSSKGYAPPATPPVETMESSAANELVRAAKRRAAERGVTAGRGMAEREGGRRLRTLGTAAAIGVPAAAGGGYLLGRPSEEELHAAQTKNRNVAFGAGAAAGLSAPFVIRGLGQIANSAYGGGQGLTPGMYPSLVPGQDY